MTVRENFDNLIQRIVNIHTETVWNPAPERLTCCIIEPRNHACLEGVLNNMANVYANTDAGLIIFHSRANLPLVKRITQNWENVQLFMLRENNLRLEQYNTLLTTRPFWNHFSSSHVLIFQTDSLIFKRIPEFFFDFDYVGAPWAAEINPSRRNGNMCGNGGFSLRKVAKMKRFTTLRLGGGTAEDVWFSKFKMRLPSREEQASFSCEELYHEEPVGCHKPFRMGKPNYTGFYENMHTWLAPTLESTEAALTR